MGLHFRISAPSVGEALQSAILDLATPQQLSVELTQALYDLTRNINRHLETQPSDQLTVSASENGVAARVAGLHRMVSLPVEAHGTFVLTRDFLMFGDRLKWVSGPSGKTPLAIM